MRVQIENYRKLSGKAKVSMSKKGVPVMKMLRDGSQFNEERYLSADTVFTSEEGLLGNQRQHEKEIPFS